jgi:hypothetical protein
VAGGETDRDEDDRDRKGGSGLQSMVSADERRAEQGDHQ